MRYADNFVEAHLKYGTWGGELIRELAIRGYAGYHIRKLAIHRLLSPIIERCHDVLDIGCGVGDHLIKLSRRYPDKQFMGIDIEASLINNARKRVEFRGLKNLSFNTEDCLKMDLKKTFDLVYTVDTMEHLDNIPEFIAGLRKVLRPNGYLAIHVPNLEQKRHFPGMMHVIHDDHIRTGFSLEELGSMLNIQDFQVLSNRYTHGYWGSLAWELSYLSRKKPIIAGLLVPAVQVFCLLDHFSHNESGNGILILAQCH